MTIINASTDASLKNKVIILTGALGILGSEIAKGCISQGATIIALDVPLQPDFPAFESSKGSF